MVLAVVTGVSVRDCTIGAAKVSESSSTTAGVVLSIYCWFSARDFASALVSADSCSAKNCWARFSCSATRMARSFCFCANSLFSVSISVVSGAVVAGLLVDTSTIAGVLDVSSLAPICCTIAYSITLPPTIIPMPSKACLEKFICLNSLMGKNDFLLFYSKFKISLS